jgi:hypothetical protein
VQKSPQAEAKLSAMQKDRSAAMVDVLKTFEKVSSELPISLPSSVQYAREHAARGILSPD